MHTSHQTRPFRRLQLLCVWCAALMVSCVGSVQTTGADDRIWSALLLATNVESPKKPAGEVARFSGAVERFFGYNQLELIGSATKTIDEKCERWLVPSQNFWLSVKAKKGEESNYLLDVNLFHDKRKLVETQAKLATASPLIIRGPMHARGQLLIVLQVIP